MNDRSRPKAAPETGAGLATSVPPAPDTAPPPRHETRPLPHGLTAVLVLRDPRDAAVDRYARELIGEGWDPSEARAVARQHDADQRAAAS